MTRAARPPSPFRHRGFRVYWAGGLCSNVGTWLHNVTASVVMFQLTDSPLMVGVLGFANFFPILALSLIGGVVSDRVDRRRVVVICSALSALASATLTAAALAGRVTPALLLATSLVLGCAYAFSKPALSAMLPALVEPGEIAHATAINTLQFTAGQVVGSSLSALILALAAPSWAFGLNALTYAALIAAMAGLRLREEQIHAGRASGWASLREGLAFVGRGGLAPLLLAVVFTNGVSEGIRTLAPVLTERDFGGSAEEAGVLVAGASLGAVLAAMTFGRVSVRLTQPAMVRVGCGLQVLGALGCALAPSLPVAVAAALPAGFGFSLLIPVLNGTLQERTPDELRGRVMAAFAMAHLGLRPVLTLTAGALATAAGARAALAVLSASALLGLATLRGGRIVSSEMTAANSPLTR